MRYSAEPVRFDHLPTSFRVVDAETGLGVALCFTADDAGMIVAALNGQAPAQPAAAPGRVFVFGSNSAGVHGAGSALAARSHHGAVQGVGEGHRGNSYAIPTKDRALKVLPIQRIKDNVETFLNFAKVRPDLTFEVTKIGCGLAGFSEAHIAPMFANAPPNCELPPGWREAPHDPVGYCKREP